jgi:ABC-type uncharacterized transport system fused permease/ATPase subunit
MDEATSAMDEEDEATLYQALIDELPGLSIVSVGHRRPQALPWATCADRQRASWWSRLFNRLKPALSRHGHKSPADHRSAGL